MIFLFRRGLLIFPKTRTFQGTTCILLLFIHCMPPHSIDDAHSNSFTTRLYSFTSPIERRSSPNQACSKHYADQFVILAGSFTESDIPADTPLISLIHSSISLRGSGVRV